MPREDIVGREESGTLRPEWHLWLEEVEEERDREEAVRRTDARPVGKTPDSLCMVRRAGQLSSGQVGSGVITVLRNRAG